MPRSHQRAPSVFGDAPQSAAQITTLMTMSPFVISARMMQFWMTAAAPTAASRSEATRMVGEKMEAAGESLMAMNLAAFQAMTDATMAAATGQVRRTNDGDSILAAGLRPYTSRVRANRRRLSQ